jgi:citrate synthase
MSVAAGAAGSVVNDEAGKPVAAKGLKGVVAADSAVCEVDGALGKLIYRGYNIHELADNSSFEEVVFLLLNGELPSAAQLAAMNETLAKHREVSPAVIVFLKTLPQDANPMAALRTAISLEGIYDPLSEVSTKDANWQKSLRLIALCATVVAAFQRIRQGHEPVSPRSDLSHAANFLYMLNGKAPTAAEEHAMDLILILHAEHGFNASTFAARVIAATLSDLYSVVTGAIGALKGPLHGGANTEVLKTLMEIGSVENVAEWVANKKAKKEVFMGFGHAVYQVADPRARHLKALSQKLGQESGNPLWYDLSVEVEKQVTGLIKKPCNVDFYSASLQYYMGIPGDLFTCIFAMSRVSGWCAHVLEQWVDNKIIRPSSHYIGPAEREYAKIETRPS